MKALVVTLACACALAAPLSQVVLGQRASSQQTPASPATRIPCGALVNGVYKNPSLGVRAVHLEDWLHDLKTPLVLRAAGTPRGACNPDSTGQWERIDAVFAQTSLVHLITVQIAIYAHKPDVTMDTMMRRGVLEIERAAARNGYQGGGEVDQRILPFGDVPVQYTLIKSSALMGRTLYTAALSRYCGHALVTVAIIAESPEESDALHLGSIVEFAPCADQVPRVVPDSPFSRTDVGPDGRIQRVAPPSSSGAVDNPRPPVPTPSPTAAPASNDWFSGRWTGPVRQTGVGEYPVEITATRNGPSVGADIKYPTLGCVMRWTRETFTDRLIVFRQTIVSGNCLAGWIRFELRTDDSVVFSSHKTYVDARDGASPLVAGTVSRVRGER